MLNSHRALLKRGNWDLFHLFTPNSRDMGRFFGTLYGANYALRMHMASAIYPILIDKMTPIWEGPFSAKQERIPY